MKPSHQKLSYFYSETGSQSPQSIKLVDTILSTISIAEKNNKLLLIIVGESHENKHSLNTILELMEMCHLACGINELAVEYDSNDSIAKLLSSEKKNINFYHYLTKAITEKWNILPIDKYHQMGWEFAWAQKKSPMQIRDDGMTEALLAQTNHHTLSIIGAQHLYGLAERKAQLSEKFELLFINTVDYKNSAYPSGLESNWAMREENAVQLRF